MFSAIVVSTLLQGQLEAVKESLKNFGHVEFDYQADYEWFGDREGAKHPAKGSYTGKVKIKAATALVVVETTKPYQENDTILTKASFSPTKVSYMARIASRKEPLYQGSRPGGYLSTRSTDEQLFAWFPSATLLVANAEDDQWFFDLGDELKEGRRCRLIAHRYFSMETKYWVDLERNGLVIATEGRMNDRLGGKIVANDVRLHEAKNGRKVWLPTIIVDERFAKPEREIKGLKPGDLGYRKTYRIIPESVRLGDGKSKLDEVKPGKELPEKPGGIGLK